jgi:hypothetical protein
VRDGLVTPALTPGRPLQMNHPRGAKLAEVLAELEADRGER